jgi:pilus assembly protein CpaD
MNKLMPLIVVGLLAGCASPVPPMQMPKSSLNCPDWSADDGHSNQPSPNFGCADAINLKLMVADPNDLVNGKTPGNPQGDGAFSAYERYRSGKVKSLTGEAASTTYAPPAPQQ